VLATSAPILTGSPVRPDVVAALGSTSASFFPQPDARRSRPTHSSAVNPWRFVRRAPSYQTTPVHDRKCNALTHTLANLKLHFSPPQARVKCRLAVGRAVSRFVTVVCGEYPRRVPTPGGRPEDRPPLLGVRGGVAFRDAVPDLETALAKLQ